MHNNAVLPTERVDDLAHSFHSDPLTGFGNHDKLIADLTRALEPDRPRSVLAVFDFVGRSEHRRIFGLRASDGLANRFAEAFTLVMSRVGTCYYIPREDEFCVLIAQSIGDVRLVLVAALGALNDVGEPFLVTAAFGGISLPDEAADPIEALILADERLGLGVLSGKARERRQNARPSEGTLSQAITLGLGVDLPARRPETRSQEPPGQPRPPSR